MSSRYLRLLVCKRRREGAKLLGVEALSDAAFASGFGIGAF
jgi:hypothetical protein